MYCPCVNTDCCTCWPRLKTVWRTHEKYVNSTLQRFSDFLVLRIIGTLKIIEGQECFVYVGYVCRYLPCVVLSCSEVSVSLWPPWTVARQAPLSMEFSRQEYLSGLPFPTQGIFPTQGGHISCVSCIGRLIYH